MITNDFIDMLFELECDVCGKTANKSFDSFNEAVKWKRDNGWTSRKEGDQWLDVCPDCKENNF